MPAAVITPRVGPMRGAAGSCVARWAAIPARPITSRDHGLTMDPTRAVPPSVPSWFGLTTSAKLSDRKTVSGSSRAATTAMPFGRDRDRWRVLSRSGTPTLRSRRRTGCVTAVPLRQLNVSGPIHTGGFAKVSPPCDRPRGRRLMPRLVFQ
jgi:hypothetical protein